MMTQQIMTIPRYVRERVVGGSATRNIGLVLSASILLVLAARAAVPVPFSPVPMTLQPLAVLLIGAALGTRRGGAAAALYLAYGAIGLPVFAHPLGLLGPTAGYLIAFPLAAALVGLLAERGWTARVPLTVATMAAGIAVIHLGGWSWLAIGVGAAPAFAAGVVPFIAGDLLKIAIGAALLPTAQRLVR
jgi:biotin transport system substrate-specific component